VGKLRGQSILVTGFTDERGDTKSNMELGMIRAEKVAQEIAAHGVPTSRIYVRSRGERLASGDDVSGRAYDRRVELRLVERDL
jgi:outer membrane protein OmpA-like peptidoglycan-associated protein